MNNLVPGMSTNLLLLHVLLTSACCVHSNVYGLINTCCIRYHTVVDSSHSTSPPVQNFYFPTRGSVDIPLVTTARNSSSIGEEPVCSDIPPIISIKRSATSSLVSYTEQGGITTFTNVLQVHKTVVLVCCTIE